MGRFHSDNPGALIREARLDLGITQTELARRAGLSQSSLAQMELGTRNVSSDMLERVLKAADYRPSVALELAFEQILEEAEGLGLRNLRVFGSVARGDDGFDSDIDFLVTPDQSVELFDIAYFGECVRQITGFPADVIVNGGSIPPGREALQEALPFMTSSDAEKCPFRGLPRRERSGIDYDHENIEHELTMILHRARSVAASPRGEFYDGAPVYDAASMAVIRLASLTERAEFDSWMETLMAQEVAGIRAMSNIVLHAYYATMDDDIFWETVTESIPTIVDRLLRY